MYLDAKRLGIYDLGVGLSGFKGGGLVNTVMYDLSAAKAALGQSIKYDKK